MDNGDCGEVEGRMEAVGETFGDCPAFIKSAKDFGAEALDEGGEAAAAFSSSRRISSNGLTGATGLAQPAVGGGEAA